jgi:hypothetical protein
MDKQPASRKDQQIIGYQYLRMLIGACGIALPGICLIYGLANGGVQESISDYYYTGVRDIFVGILFVLGFFLLSYRGYEAIDSRFANLGFFFALGVALFPCKSPTSFFPIIHFASAFLLFSVFIFFSLFLFTKSAKDGIRTPDKDKRNRIYIVCGWVMIFCIVGIGLGMALLSGRQMQDGKITFWLETVALVAFAISWLTKAKFYLEVGKLAKKVKEKVQTSS